MRLRSAMSIYRGISKNPPELSLFVSLQINQRNLGLDFRRGSGHYYVYYPLPLKIGWKI